MTSSKSRLLSLLGCVALLAGCATTAPTDSAGRPMIRKLGTIDLDLVETTPIVFKGRVYRFEWVRARYEGNQIGDHFRLVDRKTGAATEPFAHRCRFGSAFVDGDTVYVTGTRVDDAKFAGGDNVLVFASRDLETWESWPELQLTGWEPFDEAERFRRQGRHLQSVEQYEAALDALQSATVGKAATVSSGEVFDIPPDQRLLLLKCRMVQAYDELGQFDRAVEIYLDVLGHEAALMDELRPRNLPPERSTFLKQALQRVDEAIDDYGVGDVATMLTRWRNSWPGVTSREVPRRPRAAAPPEPSPVASDPEPPEETAVETVAPVPSTPVTAPTTPAPMKELTDDLSAIAISVRAGEYAEAINRLDQMDTETARAHATELHYWRGQATAGLAGRAADDEKAALRARAGLALMWVVIHDPDHDLAPQCLYVAGQLCHDARRSDQAARLWGELLHRYPDATTWTQKARDAMSQLGAAEHTNQP